jgi:hypothetical protein
MPSDNLTAPESATLIVLMAENRDILNTELVKSYYLRLDRTSRDKLKRLGYIEVGKVGRVMNFSLTDAGWARCREPFDFKDSAARFAGATLATLMRAVQQDLERSGRSPAMAFGSDVTSAPDSAAGTGTTTDLLEQIRLAYKTFAAEAGDWVNIADIRETLSSVGRDEMDGALRELEQQRDVNIVPQADENALSERTRRAAVIIGRQHKHFIAIGV